MSESTDDTKRPWHGHPDPWEALYQAVMGEVRQLRAMLERHERVLNTPPAPPPPAPNPVVPRAEVPAVVEGTKVVDGPKSDPGDAP